MSKTFGVLCDSMQLKKWQFDSIQNVIKETNYKLEIIILNKEVKKF